MAGTTLRDYIREIEKQVEGKRYDEAIAHSRYLLQTYPKHVEIYRLLGKAFLENQRYGDAADIFQRVLSAVPDDFVSHAGMSIIREDEGNFDEAIWHMKRAFDVQPSNSAIQDELRRMIGRRDNVEPPKIRLTRGALARMYYRGELFPQAIAETRAALAESPDRMDLQALLAEIYFAAGHKTEAVDVANNLLRRLPFCLTANRILYETLKGSDRDAEARTYLERLSQLDPYYAFVSPSTPGPENVPDTALRIEKLDWTVAQSQVGRGGQPLWAASLGVMLGESLQSDREVIPDWLAGQPDNEPLEPAEEAGIEGAAAFIGSIDVEGAAAAEVQPDLDAAIPGDDQIPDWMKDLGWSPASPEALAAEAETSLEQAPSEEVYSEELVPSDLPEWLQAISPSEEIGSGETEDVTPWLDRLLATSETEQPAAPAAESEAADEGLPDWLTAGVAAGAAAALVQDEGTEQMEAGEETPAAEADIPNWLAAIEEPEQPAEEGLPDWLTAGMAAGAAAAALSHGEEAGQAETGEEEAAAEAEIPGWLYEDAEQRGVSPAEAAAAAGLAAAFAGEPPAEEAAPAEDLPAWLFEAESEAQPAPAPTGADDLPEWLQLDLTDEDQALEQELEIAPEGELQPEPVEDISGLPDWLLQELPAEEAATPEPAADVTGAAPAEEGAEDTWLVDFEGTPEAEPPDVDEIPGWLAVMAAKEIEKHAPVVPSTAEEFPPVEQAAAAASEPEPTPAVPAAPPAPAAPAASAETEEAFNWLAAMLLPRPEPPKDAEPAAEPEAVTAEAAPVEAAASAEASAETPAIEAASPEPSPAAGAEADFGSMPLDEDAAFAWLESLAVRQGATEALLLAPEERQEAPPEWVQQAAESAEAAEAVEAAELEQEAPEAAEAEVSEEGPEGIPAAGIAAAAFAAATAVEEPAAPVEVAPPPAAEAALPVEAVVEPEAAPMIDSEHPGKRIFGREEPAVTPEIEAAEEAGEVPELPDWLAEGELETREENLEWQPPVVTRRRYDLNRASLVELERLPGIGFIMAQRIVDYRQQHGRFERIEDLLNVDDFTAYTLEGVRDNLYITPVEPLPAPAIGPKLPGTEPIAEPSAPPAAPAEAPEAVMAARALAAGDDWDAALQAYQRLIAGSQHLDAVIPDLDAAAKEHPQDIAIWQSLGDAYLRSNRLKEALDAFTQAEKLLRL